MYVYIGYSERVACSSRGDLVYVYICERVIIKAGYLYVYVYIGYMQYRDK